MSEQHLEAPSVRSSGRSRAIWLLATASLLPGVVAVLAREFFHSLPYGFRVTVYVLSSLMMTAVVVLLLTHKESA